MKHEEIFKDTPDEAGEAQNINRDPRSTDRLGDDNNTNIEHARNKATEGMKQGQKEDQGLGNTDHNNSSGGNR